MDSRNVTSADPFGFGATLDSLIGSFLGVPKEDGGPGAGGREAAAGTFSGKKAETDAEHVREFTKEAGQPTPDTPRGSGAGRSFGRASGFESRARRAGRAWTAPRSSSSRR